MPRIRLVNQASRQGLSRLGRSATGFIICRVPRSMVFHIVWKYGRRLLRSVDATSRPNVTSNLLCIRTSTSIRARVLRTRLCEDRMRLCRSPTYRIRGRLISASTADRKTRAKRLLGSFSHLSPRFVLALGSPPNGFGSFSNSRVRRSRLSSLLVCSARHSQLHSQLRF